MPRLNLATIKRKYRAWYTMHHASSMQIDLGAFGLWSWGGNLTALEPGKNGSRLLILTDGDPEQLYARTEDGGGAKMVGYARFYEGSDGEKREDWRQPPGGLPSTWRMYPFHRPSAVHGLVYAHFSSLGLDIEKTADWETAFPLSEDYWWPGFGETKITEKKLRVVRFYASPTDVEGAIALYQGGASQGNGVWKLGAESWFSVGKGTWILEMEHHLRMEEEEVDSLEVLAVATPEEAGSPAPAAAAPDGKRSGSPRGKKAR